MSSLATSRFAPHSGLSGETENIATIYRCWREGETVPMAICGNCFNQLAEGSICSICGCDNTREGKKHLTALPAGTVLNQRYFVGRVLGQGGFGVTYLAQDYATKDRIAIKEYFPTDFIMRVPGMTAVRFQTDERAADFETGKQQFLEEARTLAELIGDEHIVRIYRYFEENGTAYFAMEYVEGKPLNDYLEERKQLMTTEEANALFLPLMESLANVHSKGIVHRDISPDNIIIRPDGSGKIIDFGAARYSTGEMSKSLDVVLKHGFAPLEQYTRRGRQGPFTDVYALAATYYFAVTGRVPPDAADRVSEDLLAAPGELNAKISKSMDSVLLRALAVDYRDRYQTMTEFRTALVDAGRGKGERRVKASQKKGRAKGVPQTAGSAAGTVRSGAGKKRKALIVPVSVATVLVITLSALTVWYLRTNPERTLRKQYDQAIDLREKGQYAEAILTFEALGDYEDAGTQILATWYAQGVEKSAAGDWENAVSAFENAGDYSDAAKQISAAWYAEGREKESLQNWTGAREAYLLAGSYQDAEERANSALFLEAERLYYEARDHTSAYQLVKDHEKSATANMLAFMGDCNYKGSGTKENNDEAYRLYSLAAEQDNPLGLYGKGLCIKFGYGVEKNEEEGDEFLFQACQGLVSKAAEESDRYVSGRMYWYAAHCYMYGHGVKKDEEKADEFARLGAALGDPDSCRYMANSYVQEKDYSTALSIAEIGAVHGSIDCAYLAGLLYEGTLVAEPDPEKAIEYFQIGIDLIQQDDKGYNCTLDDLETAMEYAKHDLENAHAEE